MKVKKLKLPKRPWKYYDVGVTGPVVMSPDGSICKVEWRLETITRQVGQVLAAAPDLLHACELVMQWWHVMGPENSPLLHQMEDAIRKAYGEDERENS